jgi:Protein of unknown function (DUF1571)
MIKAKDCRRWLMPAMVTSLGLGLSVLATGCSSLSGFRSVGAERPSLLSFWERPAGTPTPENDPYVLSLRAGQARAAELAKQNKESASGSDGTKRADGSDSVPSRRQNSKERVANRDDAIRVSLGRPEPLPGVGVALASTERPASTAAASSSWKADPKNEPDSESVAELSDTVDPSEIREPEPARSANVPRSAPGDDWKTILTRAAAKLGALQTYQMRVSRMERVGGQIQPEEEILLSIRRDPKAVRLEWASGPSKGREVIYSSVLDPRMIFVHMPPTAIPLPVMKIPVDSPLVMRNSRHAITEAGLDTIVDNLRKSERGSESPSSAGVVSYKGTEKPAGLDRTCHHFVRKTSSGETWNIYLDERSLLPSMVIAHDSRGAMIERYVYREILENPADLAVASAFEPDQRWGESKGLLGRLARAAAGNNVPAANAATTR